MKDKGRPGKRSGPVGYRTASTFLHRKSAENSRLRSQMRKEEQKRKKK